MDDSQDDDLQTLDDYKQKSHGDDMYMKSQRAENQRNRDLLVENYNMFCNLLHAVNADILLYSNDLYEQGKIDVKMRDTLDNVTDHAFEYLDENYKKMTLRPKPKEELEDIF